MYEASKISFCFRMQDWGSVNTLVNLSMSLSSQDKIGMITLAITLVARLMT